MGAGACAREGGQIARAAGKTANARVAAHGGSATGQASVTGGRSFVDTFGASRTPPPTRKLFGAGERRADCPHYGRNGALAEKSR